jgi:hypothetical protein
MSRYRRNADVDLRELERRAAQGVPGAYERLMFERVRVGKLTYEDAVALMVVQAGPILGWVPSWEHPGVLQLTPAAPWNDHVVILATPWWDRAGTSFSPISIAWASGAHTVPMRDLFTPNTGDLVHDTENFRRELAGAISALSAAGAALLVNSVPLDQAEDILYEGLRGGP